LEEGETRIDANFHESARIIFLILPFWIRDLGELSRVVNSSRFVFSPRLVSGHNPLPPLAARFAAFGDLGPYPGSDPVAGRGY
jgi:hypothetical protein